MATHLARQLQAAGRTMIESGLTWGNAGNVSVRVDASSFLVTASGTRLGELGKDDFVRCSLDGTVIAGARKPSKEVPMHRAVYAARPDIQAVLHGAPFYSTLISCSRLEVPAGLFVETIYYLERLSRVGYHHPGSEALGEAVFAKAKEANLLLLENHGVLAYDSSVSEALQALQVLELACKIVVTARGAGLELALLDDEVMQDFLTRAAYKPRRDWPE